MAIRQTLVFLYCQACRLLHLAPALAWRYRAKEGQKKVSLRHVCVGGRVVRIELNRLIVVVDALPQIETVEIGIRPQIIVVRLRVYLFHLRYRSRLGPTQFRFDLLGDGRCHFILQCQHIREVAFKSIRPEVPVVGGAHQLRCDAYAIAGPLY